MERIKQKMERARQQRNRLQDSPDTNTAFVTSKRGSNTSLGNFIRHITPGHDASLLLGGAAAGITAMAVVSWMTSAEMAGDAGMVSLESAGAVQTMNAAAFQSGTDGIRKPIDDVAHLNERVESLDNTISSLEVKLMRVLVLTDAIADTGSNLVTAARYNKPAMNEAVSVFDTMEPTASGMVHAVQKTEKKFTPTHAVKAKLNLRPSASINTTPITVLKAGAQVESINEIEGWFYVNTSSGDKGWCASNYLSSLNHQGTPD